MFIILYPLYGFIRYKHRIDDDRNDLPIEYKAYKYPALIIYPAYRLGLYYGLERITSCIKFVCGNPKSAA